MVDRTEKEEGMLEQRLVLCPKCGECPEIIIDKKSETVSFEENGKRFTLSKTAWNELVALIKGEKLKELI